MRKRILSGILSFVLLLSLLPTVAFAADAGLKASATTAKAGEEVTVTYTVPNQIAEANAVALKVRFDKTRFQLKEVTPWSNSGVTIMTSDVTASNNDGEVTMSANDPTGGNFNIPANTVFLTAVFTAQADVTGSAQFSVDTSSAIISDVLGVSLDETAGVVKTPVSVVIPITDASSISATVAAPEKGKALATAAQATVPENAPYTVTDVKWFEGEGSNNTPVTGNAKPSQKYSVQLTVTANEGECFDWAALDRKSADGGYVITYLGNKTEPTSTTLCLFKIFTQPTAGANALLGSVAIDGADSESVYRYASMLTAQPNLDYNNEGAGELTYQWFRGETALTEKTTTATYTPVEADIDQSIKVRVWNSNNSGYVQSDEIMINKALNSSTPNAPAAGSVLATSDTITVNYTGVEGKTYQYAVRLASDTESELTWLEKGKKTFTGLNPNRDYNIYVREAETNTHEPSNKSDPLAVTTAKGTVASGSQLANGLLNSVEKYQGEYDGTSHNAFTFNNSELTGAGWKVQYRKSGGSSEYQDAISVQNVNDSGDYDAKFSHADYDNYTVDSAYQVSVGKATNYLTVTQKDDVYETTTIDQIIASHLKIEKAQGKADTLALPEGTISLTAQNGGDYPDGFKFPAGKHTLNYTFTPDEVNKNNYDKVTGSLTLNVQERGVESISLETEPTKKDYKYGQSISAADLDIWVKFTDGEERALTADERKNVTITPQPLTVGQTEVTVTYQGKSTTLTGLNVTAWEIDPSVMQINLTSSEPIEYNGEAQEPKFEVKFDSGNGVYTPIPRDQYTVKYENNTNAGTAATITIASVADANYSIIGGTKSTTFEIKPAKVTIAQINIKQKTYDGKKAAEIDSVDFSGVYAKDSAVTVSFTGVRATFNSMDVQEADTVTIENPDAFTMTGTGSTNYTIDTTNLKTTITGVSILPREITLTQLGAKSKNYDTTDTAEVDQNKVKFNEEPQVCEGSGKDVLTVTATAKFSDANAGENKTVTFSNVALGGASRIRTNYKLIVTAPLTTTARIYQHNIQATGVQKNGTLLLRGMGEFADPTIDGVNNEKVTGSFTYSYDGATTKEAISQKLRDKNTTGSYSVGFTFTPATDGNYTGTVTGTLTITVQDVTFKRGSDTITSTTGMFEQNKDKTYCGKGPDYYVSIYQKDTLKAYVGDTEVPGTFYYTVDGTRSTEIAKLPAANNHKFQLYFSATDKDAYPNDIPVGSESGYGIWHAVIKVEDGANNGITVTDHQYDGTTDVAAGAVNVDNVKFTIVPSTNSNLTAIPAGDEVKLAYTTAAYDDADAGDRTVTLGGLSLTGADKANYTLQNNVTTLPGCDGEIDVPAKITPKDVTITGAAVEATKEYDGNTSATITNNGTLSWKFDTDDMAIEAGTATYDNKNVSTGKKVTFSGFSLSGTDKDNYNLTAQPAPTTANITAKELRITNFTVKDKVYDGNDIAEIVSIETDAVEGDDVKCSNAIARFVASGTFSASDAQNGKKVVLLFPQGVILAGADKDNYTFDSADLPDEVTATIHKANLTGAPTFTKITQSGKTLNDLKVSDIDLSGIHGVKIGDAYDAIDLTFSWDEADTTTIQANKSYSWTVTASYPAPRDTVKNYNVLTGSVVLYPVSTGYSEQVKKQIEEFEAKKRGELPESDTTFRDVSEDDYFFDAVNWAAENGITGGVSANRFGPTQDCSRGQTMTFLWRAMGEPEPASRASDLTDVMTGSYYYDAVLWAMEAGITTGAGANRFAPDATVTRGQFVTFLYRLANASSDGVHPFTDVPAGSYYEKAIAWAYAEGITKGTGATTFSPDAPCTRAQIITFLYRYFNR